MELLAAVPVLNVSEPEIGYIEVGLDRGEVVSRTVTIVNDGLKVMRGIELIAPTNVTWIIPALVADADGHIRLPDLDVGESATFTVSFAPPETVIMGDYDDVIEIKGTNDSSRLLIHAYARVTSNKRGDVQFFIDSILGLPVAGAKIRMRNTILNEEIEIVYTDTNGLAIVTGLQEGWWSYQVAAPGYGINANMVRVIPDQVVQESIRLPKSLVTITFEVVPVPFTDRYEIRIDQTFETHVTAPVFVLDPPSFMFTDVKPGFKKSFTAVAKNHGLIALDDIEIESFELPWGTLIPLITYIPRLNPFESIEIPYELVFNGDEDNEVNIVTPPSMALMSYDSGGGDFDINAETTGSSLDDERRIQEAIKKLKDLKNFQDCIAGGFIGLGDTMKQLDKIQKYLVSRAKAGYVCYQNPEDVIPTVKSLLVWITVWNFFTMGEGDVVVNVVSCTSQYNASNQPPKKDDGQSGKAGGSGSVRVGDEGSDKDDGKRNGNGRGSSDGTSVGGAVCFAADTEVLMANGGIVPIETIIVGDVVKTGQGAGNIARVVKLVSRESDHLRVLSFATDNSVKTVELKTTDGHRIWIDGIGWKLASQINIGDYVVSSDGALLKLIDSKRIENMVKVFSMQLREDTVFYANGILVHDLCGAELEFYEEQGGEN